MNFGLEIRWNSFSGVLVFALCPCAPAMLLLVGMARVNEAFIAMAVSAVPADCRADGSSSAPTEGSWGSVGYSAAIFWIGFVFHVLLVAF